MALSISAEEATYTPDDEDYSCPLSACYLITSGSTCAGRELDSRRHVAATGQNILSGGGQGGIVLHWESLHRGI